MLGAQENFTLIMVATNAPTMKTPSNVAAQIAVMIFRWKQLEFAYREGISLVTTMQHRLTALTDAATLLGVFMVGALVGLKSCSFYLASNKSLQRFLLVISAVRSYQDCSAYSTSHHQCSVPKRILHSLQRFIGC
jgi:hypothetical protein